MDDCGARRQAHDNEIAALGLECPDEESDREEEDCDGINSAASDNGALETPKKPPPLGLGKPQLTRH